MAQRILVLFAHPAIRRSRVNSALFAGLKNVPEITLHDLYETYPDFAIDVDKEQQLLLDHDIIVFQHPLYWYSAPAILKEWIDLVLELGFAYGKNGDKLAGKAWLQAITTGGRDQAYRPDGLNRFTIDELLRPFEATAHLCKMTWLPPFVTHAAHFAGQAEIAESASRYRGHLIGLTGAHALTSNPSLEAPL